MRKIQAEIQQRESDRKALEKERAARERKRVKLVEQEEAELERRKDEVLKIPFPVIRLLYKIAAVYQDREELKITVAGSPSQEYTDIVRKNREFLGQINKKFKLSKIL